MVVDTTAHPFKTLAHASLPSAYFANVVGWRCGHIRNGSKKPMDWIQA
jgi:hypothetical protein